MPKDRVITPLDHCFRLAADLFSQLGPFSSRKDSDLHFWTSEIHRRSRSYLLCYGRNTATPSVTFESSYIFTIEVGIAAKSDMRTKSRTEVPEHQLSTISAPCRVRRSLISTVRKSMLQRAADVILRTVECR